MICSKRTARLPSLALPLSLMMSSAVSADPRVGEEAVKIRLGAFLSDFDTDIGLTGPAGGDPAIDLEDDLGLDSNLRSFRGELIWRFAPRHRAMLGYYDFRRSATGSARRQIEIDDPDNGLIVIEAGVSATSKFKWRLIPVSYAYSFVKTNDLELAGTIGVHWFNLEVGVSGQASVNGNPVAFTTQSEAAAGPLPVFGLHADHAFSSNWTLGAKVEFFTLDYDDYSGDLIDLRLQTEYWFSDSVGVGLGYTWYNINLDKRLGRGFELSTDYSYGGPEAYLGLRF